MPTFAFICHPCGHSYEEFRFPSEGMPPACPSCGQPFGGEEFNQNWKENRPLGLCKGEDRITTWGQQSEYNKKRLGKEQMELQGLSSPKEDPDEIPWYRSGEVQGLDKMDKPLDLSAIKDPNEYIMTGKK